MDGLTDFLENYGISRHDFILSQCKWQDLQAIKMDFLKVKDDYEDVAEAICKELWRGPAKQAIHSIRSRVKDPDHLAEKIIRKRAYDRKHNMESPRPFSLETYRDDISDLVGVRIIHLFKKEWITIHEFIESRWRDCMKGRNPVAFYREGDSKEVIEEFEGHGCKVEQHEKGYRSVHYDVDYKKGAGNFRAEIQVRTLFEEGWSEVDHRVRYPRNDAGNQLEIFLQILNRQAGTADEMASFVSQLIELERDSRTMTKPFVESFITGVLYAGNKPVTGVEDELRAKTVLDGVKRLVRGTTQYSEREKAVRRLSRVISPSTIVCLDEIEREIVPRLPKSGERDGLCAVLRTTRNVVADALRIHAERLMDARE